MHIPAIFSDLALILVVASVTTLLFKWLKQPVVLGYIIAGIITGPHTHFFMTVQNIGNIEVWGQIGVAFLLFELGLEFSFKKMRKVGKTGGITAITELIIMFSAGFVAGYFLGWSTMNSIFLGGMLTISSTSIIIKAFDDLGVRKQKFTNVVFGVLVVEDLIAVLQLVLLSTIAVSRTFDGVQLGLSISKMIIFIVFWFVVGIYLIPSFFKVAKKMLGEETLLIITIGLCFGMIFLADKMGLSAALGAFLMGSILAETVESEKIIKLINPLKYLFGAVFFVSVGMLVDFKVVTTNYLPILMITFMILFIKTFSAGIGVLISGQPLKIAVQTAMSLSQIGEFSFIIASLGLSLKVIDPVLYPIIVAVSVITTFTTPYFIRFSGSFYEFLNRKLPPYWKRAIEQISISANQTVDQDIKRKYLKRYISRTAIYVILIIAIQLISFLLIEPLLNRFLPMLAAQIIGFSVTFIALAPILGALIMNNMASKMDFNRIWRKNKIKRHVLVILILFRILIIIFSLTVLITHYFTFTLAITIAILIGLILFYVASQKNMKNFIKMEERFLHNLNGHSSIPELKIPEDLTNDIHIELFEISNYSECIGKSLVDINLRHLYGVNVISIMRGHCRIDLPKRDEVLYPHDKILVVGNDKQMQKVKKLFEKDETEMEYCPVRETMDIYQISLHQDSPFVHKALTECKFTELYHCLVIGYKRSDQFVENPPSQTIFQPNDILWIVGEKNSIDELEQMRCDPKI
jgi:monovalent cation:H+ antiporter-2, CPA2 family